MRRSTVLVVEADQSIRKLFEDILRMEGYRVRALEQEALGLPRIAAAEPDLLLLEITSATATQTLALIEELRQQPATATLPILLSTTNPLILERYGLGLHQLGCAVLLKPFELDELLRTVSQYLMAAEYPLLTPAIAARHLSRL